MDFFYFLNFFYSFLIIHIENFKSRLKKTRFSTHITAIKYLMSIYSIITLFLIINT